MILPTLFYTLYDTLLLSPPLLSSPLPARVGVPAWPFAVLCGRIGPKPLWRHWDRATTSRTSPSPTTGIVCCPFPCGNHGLWPHRATASMAMPASHQRDSPLSIPMRPPYAWPLAAPRNRKHGHVSSPPPGQPAVHPHAAAMPFGRPSKPQPVHIRILPMGWPDVHPHAATTAKNSKALRCRRCGVGVLPPSQSLEGI